MNIRFIGCLHFGHSAVAKWRGFQDEFEHDEHLIDTWNSVVTNKKDITYILGDITMEKSLYYPYLDRLNGVKHVVLGNHDRRQDVVDLLRYVNTVAGAVDYKGFILTHIPIHPSEVHYYRGNIHAHIHHINKLENLFVTPKYGEEGNLTLSTAGKYYNVDAKLIDFKPKTIEELLNI